MTLEPNIIKQDTCILTPRLWYKIREQLKPRDQIICDGLLNTMARVEEFWEIAEHPHWFNPARKCIAMPKGSIGKTRCKMQERTILLSPEGIEAMKTLYGAKDSFRKHQDRSNLRKALIKAAIAAKVDTTGITSKMFRKSMISWLMATIPEKEMQIQLSAGHGRDVQMMHYLAIGFEKRDVEDMRKFTRGWGE